MSTEAEDRHNEDVAINLTLKGGILDKSIPLYIAVSALGDTQTLFDKSFLTLSGKGRITSELRSKFHLEVAEIKKGSLLATLGMVFAGIQPALPAFGQLGPKGVFDLLKDSYEFIKLVLTASKEGTAVSITQNGDGNTSTVVIGNNNSVVNNVVISCAQQSLPVWEKISETASKNGIHTYLIQNKAHSDQIKLGTLDFELIKNATEISDSPFEIDAEIYDLDKFDREGWVKVKQGSVGIEKGNYRFSIIGDQLVDDYIEGMKIPQVKLKCLVEKSNDPIRGEKISRLQIISVTLP